METEAKIEKSLFNIAKFKLSGNASYQKNNIVETQITNTLISSFKSAITNNEGIIIPLSNLKLFMYKDSAAYFRSLVPVLNMIKDIDKVATMSEEDRENFAGFKIHEMGATLDSLSGYYEFICETEDNSKKIVRFNISGLRNNYTLNDLTKMNLKLYGIEVGKSKDANLAFEHMMDTMLQENVNSLESEDYDQIKEKNKTESLELPIIDILMAGV
ncbi:DUF6414 family protein [Listeria grayi]|uniref:DUF6414 family protein n=1 Tax=Listeria grayi TaxID=1641 RepID=UPI0022771CE3|nr:DUF6414 family protein [Listeria grayi]